MKTKTAVLNGKPDAGNPHVQFDEGEVASANPRRGSLLYKRMFSRWSRCVRSLSAVMAASVLSAGAVDQVSGWREPTGVHVAEGSETFTGRIAVGDGGAFVKTGAGILVVDGSRFDRSAPNDVKVLNGTFKVLPGALVRRDTPPAFVAEKAALWLDAATPSSLVAETVGESPVLRWCDRREADPTARTYPSALSGVAATGLANEDQTPPTIGECYGNRAVYFGGLGSGKHMAFKGADDSALTVDHAYHAFFVHGVSNSVGSVLSSTAANNGYNGFLMNVFAEGKATFSPATATGYFAYLRGDMNGWLWTSRIARNGQVIDAAHIPPTQGFELVSVTANEGAQRYSGLFRPRSNTNAIGGDCVSEVILFTRRLTPAEVTDVERYLMTKWSLSHDTAKAVHLDRDVARVEVAKAAKLEVVADDGEETAPLALSGNGIVEKTGAGTLVLGPSGNHPTFSGEFRLNGGKVIARGGELPAVAVKGGETLTGDYVYSSETDVSAGNQAKDGSRLAIVSGGAADVVVKNGEAEAKVRAVASGVRKLQVESGTLVLSAVSASPAAAADAATALEVVVPNAGFEEYFDENPTATGYSFSVGWHNGWYGPGSSTRYLASSDGNWKTYCPAAPTAAEGRGVLNVKSTSAYAYTKVDLPQAGTYDLSFCSTIRGTSEAVYTLGVKFGSDWNSSATIGTAVLGKADWPRLHFRFTASEAGEHVIGFQPQGNSSYKDDAFLIDDVKLFYVPEKSNETVVKVPNGDFESYVTGTTFSYYLNYNTGLVGWTFDTSESASYDHDHNSAVGACGLRQQLDYSNGKPTHLSRNGELAVGSTHLAFVGAGGKAISEAFEMPEGKYVLRAKLAHCKSELWSYLKSYPFNHSADPAIGVKLVRADETVVDLGSVTPWTHELREVSWPTEVTFAAGERVSLVLTQTNAGCAILDDLEFVACGTAEGGERVLNGSFEAPGRACDFKEISGKASVYKHERQFGANDGTAKNFGYNQYDGNYQYQLGADAGCAFRVELEDAGLHRLRFAAHSRTESRKNYGRNPVKVVVADDAGDVVADLGVFRPFGANWCEYSALFRVEAPGNYTLKFLGQETADRRTYLDGVSVRRVVEPLAAPQVPEDMRIVLAEGAKLRLDFEGTVKTGTVRINGIGYTGLIDATTCPDVVQGCGKIFATGRGSVLIFR